MCTAQQPRVAGPKSLSIDLPSKDLLLLRGK